MRTQIVGLVSTILFLTCAATFVCGDEPARTSPQDALRAYYRGLADGDAAAVLRVCLAEKLDEDLVRSQAAVSRALKHLGTAGTKRFGEDGSVLNQPLPAETILKQVEQIKVEQNGDKASWPFNPKAPLALSKVDGNWHVDLRNLIARKDERQMIELFDHLSSYLDDVARGIENGDYESVAQVQKELRRRGEAPIESNDSQTPKDIPNG